MLPYFLASLIPDKLNIVKIQSMFFPELNETKVAVEVVIVVMVYN
jgi:hypothetical protein